MSVAASIKKYVLPHMPGWAVARRNIYLPPTPDGLLRCVTFEPSGYEKDYPEVFARAIVLAMPHAHTSLSFARPRPGTVPNVYFNSPELMPRVRKCAATVAGLESVRQLVKEESMWRLFIRQEARWRTTPPGPARDFESAFLFAIVGDWSRAADLARRSASECRSIIERDPGCESLRDHFVTPCEELLNAIGRGEAAARAHLKKTAAENLAALGIDSPAFGT